MVVRWRRGGGLERFYLVQPADTRVPPRLDLLLQPRPQPQPAWLLHAAVWASAQTHLQLHGSLRRWHKLLSAAQVESYLVSGHPSSSVLQSEMSMTTMLGLHLQEKYIFGRRKVFFILQHFRQHILARGLHQGPEGHELKDVAWIKPLPVVQVLL